MQSNKHIPTAFDNALSEYGSFDENMAKNTQTEKQLVETISILEKKIAAIPSGQPIPDQLTQLLESFRINLKENRLNRHSMCRDLDQKDANAENKLFDALTKHGFFSIDVPGDTSIEDQHAIACLVERKIQEKVVPIFLQAVIDGDEKKVTELLNDCPELLMLEPPKNPVIESKLTWQRFIAEDALLMAVKRKQFEMIELLLPYYDKLPQTEDVIKAKEEALAAWSFYEMHTNDRGEEDILIPREYAQYADALVDVFSRETFPNGIPGNRGNPWYMRLSDETELALTSLFNRLLPEKAVNADYLDMELALLAAYKIYVTKIYTFQNSNQRDAFRVRVIGLIQSVLIPETAKIFCENLDAVVTAIANKQEPVISKEAAQYKLKNASAFYRDSRLSISGLGFEFLCGIFEPVGVEFGRRPWRRAARLDGPDGWHHVGKTMSSKSCKFSECYAAIAATARPAFRRAG